MTILDSNPASDDQPPLVMGVDGGGTKTTACLAELRAGQPPQVLGRGNSGPGNLLVVGEQALTNLREAIDQAFLDASLPPQSVKRLCLALAGSDRDSMRERITEWVHREDLANDLLMVHDGEAILSVVSPAVAGISLISGTGSLAYGRDAHGKSLRVGGWGPGLGDEGSGYWLVVEALRALAASFDGRQAETGLTSRLLSKLQIKEARELPHWFRLNSRETIAGLAPTVLEAARESDPQAMELCARAAADLETMIASVANQLGLEDGEFELVLAGGLLSNQTEVALALRERIEASSLSPATIHTSQDPAMDAVRLACRND